MREAQRRERRRPKASLLHTAVFASFTLLASCYPAHLPSYQKIQASSLDESALAIRRQTTEQSFIKMLKAHGGTNIVSAKGFFNGKMDSAVTADSMDYVYFFRGGRYLTRFKVNYGDRRPQIHPYLKVVYGKKGFGVLLLADNIVHRGKRVMQVLMQEDGRNVAVTFPVDDLIKRHNGMLDPYVMGEFIDKGVTMCARDREGNPWEVVYIIIKKGDRLTLEQKDRRKAETCSCFLEWLRGKGGRETSRIKVE